MAKAKVVWRERALTDIDRLYNFLYEKDTMTATKAAKIILEGALLLESTPRLGRPMPDTTHRRELFIPFGSSFYVLRYFIDGNGIVIVVRIWHSREDRTTA